MRLTLTVAVYLLMTAPAPGNLIVDFEDVVLPGEQYVYSAPLNVIAIESASPWGAYYGVSSKLAFSNVDLYWDNGDDTVVSAGGSGGSSNWLVAMSFEAGEAIFVAPSGMIFTSVEINNVDLLDHVANFGLYQSSAFQPGDYLRVRLLAFDQNNQPTGAATDWIDLATHDGTLNVLDTWTTIDLTPLNASRLGFEFVGTDNHPQWGLNSPTYLAFDNFVLQTIPQPSPPTLVASAPYHSGFPGGDWAPVDDSKQLVVAGGSPQLMGLVNLTSSSHGINGVVLDFDDLDGLADISLEYSMSPQGAFIEVNHPIAGWTAAPAPALTTFHPGEGVEGSNRVRIQWTDGAILNRYLAIRVIHDSATIAELYLGNLVGKVTAPRAVCSRSPTATSRPSGLAWVPT